jgi:hypothetical protein
MTGYTGKLSVLCTGIGSGLINWSVASELLDAAKAVEQKLKDERHIFLGTYLFRFIEFRTIKYTKAFGY